MSGLFDCSYELEGFGVDAREPHLSQSTMAQVQEILRAVLWQLPEDGAVTVRITRGSHGEFRGAPVEYAEGAP